MSQGNSHSWGPQKEFALKPVRTKKQEGHGEGDDVLRPVKSHGARAFVFLSC